MMKSLRNAVSIFIVVAMLMSIMPLGVMAEDDTITVVVPFEDYFSLRSDKPNNSGFTSTGGSSGDTKYVKLGDDYRAWAKLNLSGYEEILRLPSTKVGVNLFGGTGFSGGVVHDFQIVVLPDLSEKDIVREKTYNQINRLGYWNAKEDDEVLFVRSDATELKGYNIYVSGDADKASLINALDESYTNGIVQVGFYPYITETISDIRMNKTGYGVTITYKPSELSAATYLSSYEDDFVWENISTDEVSNVENKLPTYFRGASVTWSSDNGAVSADGTITPVIAQSGDTKLTATVTYGESSFAKEFGVTVPIAESKTVNVPFESYGCWRSDKPAQVGDPSVNDNGLKYINTGGNWKAHARVDFSAYEEILRNPHTTVTYTLSSGNGFSTGKCYDYKFVALPDSFDMYDATTISYTEANNLGWWKTATENVVFERTDSTEIKTNGNGNLKGDVNKEVLLNVLSESYTNSAVSFSITSSKQSAIAMGKANNFLTITYYPVESDDNAFFEENKENFKWENLTDDAMDSVTNNLPTYFRGGEISWASTNGHVFADGTVYGSKTEKLSDKITATYTYAGNTYSKEFDVTLAVYLPIVITLEGKVEYSTYVDSTHPDTTVGIYEKAYDQFVTENMGVFELDGAGNVKRDRMTFFKWDFSGYENILDVATDVAVVWSNKSGNYTTTNPLFGFTLMNNVNDSWLNSTLTYNTAVETGMRTDPGVFTINDVVLEKEMKITAPGLLQAFKDALAQNPENSIVSAKITGKDWNQFHIRSNSRTYDLEITYYPRDVKAKADYAAEQFDAMTWDAVSMQNIDSVVADLDLPAKVYGSKITWSSSDEGVIVSSSGEVIVGDTAKTVDLTASLGGKTKTFTVTVPASNVITNSTQMNSNGITSNIDVTTGFVYANADIEGTPDVIVATYKDGTLLSVRVHNDKVIKSGATCFYSNVYGDALKGAQTKILVVDDIETLKPLGIAK